MLGRLLQLSVIVVVSAIAASPQSEIALCSGCAAEFSASLDKRVYKLDEPVTLNVRVKNVGSKPFYIPGIFAPPGSNGGILVKVTPPKTAMMRQGVSAGDCAPDCSSKRDIVSEIKNTWILLQPDHYYGGTVGANFVPMSPGQYKISVERLPPILDASERVKLENLKIPILLVTLDTKPLYVRIIK